MLRSQKDVDKHVQEIFRKISNEKERNLRCYNVAKLYHKVGDYQSAKKYAELYIRENPKVAGAHKLLGQALEGLKEYAKAQEEYKCSLSLESKQPDLVLKVCELLVETKTKLAAGEAKYWMERAEEVADNHQTVFRLKEYLIKMEDGSGDQAQLIQLAEKEIEARPQDYMPRIRLLRLYLDTKRVQDAYRYAVDLEARCLFRDSIQWYSCVVDIFKVYYQEVKNLDYEFHLNQLCVLEHYAALCSREQLATHSSSFSSALYGLDQALFEASRLSRRGEEHLLQDCIRHISGQLSFHLGTVLLRLGKQSRSGCKEWMPMVWALMSLAYSTPEACDYVSQSSNSSGKERHKKLLKLWREDCAFRCSQAGHILISMPQERNYSIQLSGGNWKEKIFKMLFAVQIHGKPNVEKFSFFMTDAFFAEIQESIPSVHDLSLHDNMSQHQRPDSLHTLVWLGLRYLEPATKQVSIIGASYVPPHRLSPNFCCHIFEELKLSSNSLETGGVETLSRLDVDTFLYASVFCAAAAMEDRLSSSLINEGRPSVLPIDLSELLCTDAQLKWWSSAYRLHTNKSRSDIGDIRMLVTRGLEVVRLLGNHGMDVRLVVLLAKLFSEKAASLSTPKDSISAISKRALLFWRCAITLLERIDKNQPLRMPASSLFSYGGEELTRSDVKMLLDEGRFFIACRSMDEKNYEKAIEVFQDLKYPHASFYEGLIYKKLADAELECLDGDNVGSEKKSRYVILLQKSRSALHLTLDRLRSPQHAGKHPLNKELEQHLEEVENCLAREESDSILTVNQNAYGSHLDDSFSAKRFQDSLMNASRIVNTSVHHNLISNLGLSNGQSPSQGMTSTPFKTKRSMDSTVNLNVSSYERVEARPSPERLDAQLRRMTLNTDAVMQVLVEQNRQVLDSNKSMMDALDKTRAAVQELQNQMADLRHDVARLKINDGRLQTGKSGDYLSMLHPEEEYDYDVAASQLRSLQAFPSAVPYGSYPGQGFNYDSRTPSNTVQMQPILPQALFPQNQVPLPRNVDPNSLLLASYYPQAALGLNLNERQAASNVSLASPVPGVLPGLVSGSLQGPPGPSSVQTPDGGAAAEPFRKAPLSHVTIPTTVVDLSTSTMVSSVSRGQQFSVATPAVGLTNPVHQSFAIHSQQGSSMLAQSKFPVNLASGEAAPHNFQISMPPQATIPTTESLEKSLSPLKPISTETMLPNVPMPTYSAVSAKQTDLKSNRHSTGSASGNDTFSEDADYNPCADFKPIIPLPEEIIVTTGEEDETPLFVRRAKLFRFVNGEWKERGVGDMKILKHNITGKPRILMRREQIFKICANHFILPEMELAPQTGSDRAWSWGANDFSDGEPRVEKLCVRFKTVDDAQKFKDAFDEARKLAKFVSPHKVSSTAPVGKPECQSSTAQGSPASFGKVELGGFSFISPPVLKPVERQAKTTPGKDKENNSTVSKPSPFAGFSFTPTTSSSAFGSPGWLITSSSASQSTSTSSSVVSKPVFGSVSTSQSSSTSLFGCKPSVTNAASSVPSKDNPIFSTSSNLVDFAALAAKNKSLESGKKDDNFKGFQGAGSKVFGSSTPTTTSPSSKNAGEQDCGDAEEFQPTAVFNPVVPLPSLVEVKTGEEDEDVIFEERAKLLRFDTKEWKERGIGKMKVLKNRVTRKVRLLMRREQVLKVCCNHLVTPDLEFIPLKTSDKAITWSAQDFSEGEVCFEVFALRFKTPELMYAFKDVMERVQKELRDAPPVSPSTAGEEPKQSAKPLSELFKPKQGSWECSGCFTRNDADKISCPCCAQPKPGCESKVTENKPVTTSKFSFGVQPSLNQAASTVKSGTGFSFGNIATPKEKQPSLSEMFKPKEGSWVCQACYTRADADKFVCQACETPKPGYEKESSNLAATSVKSGTRFSFGNIATPKEQQPSLSEMFKPKEGSWVCQACYTRADADKFVCQACETPKPGYENESAGARSNFGMGVSSTPSATFSFGTSSTGLGQTDTKPFSFSTSAQQGESKSKFSFGIPSSGTADANKSFSFGTSALGESSTTTPSTNFSFGTSTATALPSQPSFGSPHKFEFQMRPTSPSKSPGKSPGAPSGGEESEDEVEDDNEDVGDFKPVVPLPDKVHVLTGEEDETVLYCHRAKLFRFADGEWKERGLGEIKVLRHNVTSKLRLLMRREQILKICLNHYITSDLDMISKDERTWMWGAQDFSEGVIVPEKFACRFKSVDIAEDFRKAVDDAKAHILPSPSVGGTEVVSPSSMKNDGSSVKEDTPSMKNFSFKLPSSDKPGVVRSLFGSSGTSSSMTEEVEIVYEAKVSPEEKDAALKLQLPENFYLYKQAPPCAGCPGCEKDNDSDQGDSQSSTDLKGKSESSSTSGAFNASAAVFGSGTSFFSTSSFSSPSSTMIFGGSSESKLSSTGTGIGNLFGAGTFTSGFRSTAVNSHSTAFSNLGKFATPATQEEDTQQDKGEGKSESVSFLPVSNSPSFASLAAGASSNPIFGSKDSSKAFVFAGAGSKVFGAESPPKGSSKDDDRDSEGENETADETDTHDPHFEPIIAMPDVVEVRTGEEDEEKLFCQRAKLYRYDVTTKEWKERGVGELKILKHPLNGTYRLLLRREQVHKVVLNQRVDTAMKLKPMSTSDRAWCWGSFNYAEGSDGALEELAIRFKNPELATEFRSTLEECQKKLAAETPHVQEADEEDDDEYEDEEDEGYEILFEKPVTLTAEHEDSVKPMSQGIGDIRIIQHSDSSYYVEMEDESNRVLCRAPILGDAEVQRNRNICIWRSIDLVDSDDDSGVEKKFTVTFGSETDADHFQELYSTITLQVVEQTYDYVEGHEEVHEA